MHDSQQQGTELYGVITRLMRLRDILQAGAHDMRMVQEQLPGVYEDSASGRRQLRRDIHNLQALGYQVEHAGRPTRWHITAGATLLTDDDLQALIYVRDAFAAGHPHAPVVQRWLSNATRKLSPVQAKRWRRRPALRVPLKPAIDYSAYAGLIDWLETAISAGQLIAFTYRSASAGQSVRHRRLDPYEIEYTDRHFYLLAYSDEYNTTLQFRIDRIVDDPVQRSPELLPSHQSPRREPRRIHFTYRRPLAFADGGVSERFTIHNLKRDETYVTIDASDTSEFRIVRILLGYGQTAKLVHAPASLMKAMRDTVEQMWAQYDPIDR